MIRLVRDFLELPEASSTQDEARARLNASNSDKNFSADSCSLFWVSAIRQHSGRGRQGRAWISCAGDLLVSCAFRFPEEIAVQRSLLTLIAGRALYAAVTEGTGATASLFLKWPNDLFAESGGPAKIAGVLAEGFGGAKVVVGWGLNLITVPRPLEGRNYRAAAVDEVHPLPEKLDRLGALTALQKHFEALLSAWFAQPAKFETEFINELQLGPMRAFWKRGGRLKGSGELVYARGLDTDGALLVSAMLEDPRDRWRRVLSGEFELTN